MGTKYVIEENGITIKKLLGSTHVYFADIESIITDQNHNYIKTKSGETYDLDLGFSSIAMDAPLFFMYIEKYNIAYRNMDETKDGAPVYTYDEALQVAGRTIERILQYANGFVVQKLGEGYGIETRYYDLVETFSGVDLILVKNGKPVRLSEELMRFYDKTDPGAFDSIDLFYGPVIWDADLRCAKYGVTEECRDDKVCEKTIYQCVNDLCEKYGKEQGR